MMRGAATRSGRAAAAAAGALALALAAAPGHVRAQSLAERQSLEYPVKANYLVRFAAFVQWPPPAFATPQSPVVICVLGADPFGAALDRAAAAHTAGGRPVVARRISKVDARTGCHIVYVGRSKEQSQNEALRALAGTPVLTVTDFGGPRGVIHFAVVGNKVKFHIDDRAASRGGMTISSRLLSLALSVRQRG